MAVLRGDPDAVAAVADALEFEHKYTSGVIAWAPEDRPSDQDIDRVLDKFEQTAWAGLAPDRYAWAAVRPGDGQEPQHRAAELAADLRPPQHSWPVEASWRDSQSVRRGRILLTPCSASSRPRRS